MKYLTAFVVASLSSVSAFAHSVCEGPGSITTYVDNSFVCSPAAAAKIVSDCTGDQTGTVPGTTKIAKLNLTPDELTFFVNWHRGSGDGAGLKSINGYYHMFTLYKIDAKTCDIVEVGGSECFTLNDTRISNNPYVGLPAAVVRLCQ